MVVSLSSHWLLVKFIFVLIGRCDYWFWFHDTQSKSALSVKNCFTKSKQFFTMFPLTYSYLWATLYFVHGSDPPKNKEMRDI